MGWNWLSICVGELHGSKLARQRVGAGGGLRLHVEMRLLHLLITDIERQAVVAAQGGVVAERIGRPA